MFYVFNVLKLVFAVVKNLTPLSNTTSNCSWLYSDSALIWSAHQKGLYSANISLPHRATSSTTSLDARTSNFWTFTVWLTIIPEIFQHIDSLFLEPPVRTGAAVSQSICSSLSLVLFESSPQPPAQILQYFVSRDLFPNSAQAPVKTCLLWSSLCISINR